MLHALELLPPQLDDKTLSYVSAELCAAGVDKYAARRVGLIQDKNPELAEYVEMVGLLMSDRLSSVTDWPRKSIIQAASLALDCYERAGYGISIEPSALAAGQEQASSTGIPDTFLYSTPEDPRLMRLARLTGELDPPAEAILASRTVQFDYEQVINTGYGIGRHFLQQQLALPS